MLTSDNPDTYHLPFSTSVDSSKPFSSYLKFEGNELYDNIHSFNTKYKRPLKIKVGISFCCYRLKSGPFRTSLNVYFGYKCLQKHMVRSYVSNNVHVSTLQLWPISIFSLELEILSCGNVLIYQKMKMWLLKFLGLV